MATGYQTRSQVSKPVQVPASQSAFEVCRFGINNEGQLNLKVDIYVGKVAAGGTPTLKLQDQSGWEFWNDVKSSSALTASTDKTLTPDYTTGFFTSASHGYNNGDMVALSSTGRLPGGLDQGTGRFWVCNKTTNTFQLTRSLQNGSLPVSFTDNGSGTLTSSAVRVITIALNVEVAGDQAVMPLRPQGRVVGVTGASDAIQVVDLRYGNNS